LRRWAVLPHNRSVSEKVVPKDELEAAIEARKELGAEMEPAVIDAFVERIERRLGDRAEAGEKSLKRRREHQKEMILGSMGVSIPLFVVAAIFTGLAGVIAVCVVLAVIAIVTARSQ
jgi:VIT1/CCC1 family predicted Fe2+/Mn2+ transporter